MGKLNELKEAVSNGKTKIAATLAQESIDEGVKATAVLDAMIEAMNIVGEKFSKGDIYVPEMLVASKAMTKGLEVIRPLLSGEGASSVGKCIIGTVKGDLHDIGKNLVAIMIGAAGFDVIDLGVDVPVDIFIETLKANPDCKIIALSALLTTTMPSMQETAKALIGFRDEYGFKLLIGGAPISQEFADEVGADGYAIDAGAAAQKAKELIA